MSTFGSVKYELHSAPEIEILSRAVLDDDDGSGIQANAIDIIREVIKARRPLLGG